MDKININIKTNKTELSNFIHIITKPNKFKIKQLVYYIISELKTKGKMKNNILKLWGVYTKHDINTILYRYLLGFKTCPICHLHETNQLICGECDKL